MTDFADHFSADAAGYAAHRPTYPPALVDFLAAHAAGGDTAWDCGCGSGQLAVALAARFARVIATDASASQLAAATVHPRVEYQRARAESSQLPAASVDLAVAAQAAHWFDMQRYIAEIRRVARPGALAALVAYQTGATGDVEVDAVLHRFHAETLALYWPLERRHVEDGYGALPFPFPAVEAPELWMERDWSGAEMLRYVETWSAVRALVGAGGDADVDAFRTALQQAWGGVATRRLVRWRLVIRAGRV